jgi:hypothetical protein
MLDLRDFFFFVFGLIPSSQEVAEEQFAGTEKTTGGTAT